jgi:type II secretory pathway predicted ATPase ExeA
MPGDVRPNTVPPGQAEAELAAEGGHRPHPAPFQAGTDPRLLWLGRRHQEILDQLTSGVRDQGGVLLLTGEAGTGKTILAKALLDKLRPDTHIARVIYGRHDPLDFSKEIGQAWGVADPSTTREAFYSRLPAFLDEAAARGKRVLLFVDEAQTLSQELFTEIGHLAIVAGESRAGQTPLSILLIGQDKLGTILGRPGNAPLAKRITVRCVTAPLTSAEVREYVEYQLRVAGAGRPAFTEDGLREIASASQGVPRLINTIAHLALVRGMSRCASAIGTETVRQSALMLGHPLGRVDRGRSRRARLRKRASPGFREPRHRVAVYVPILAVLLTSGGYLYLSDAARGRDAGPVPETSSLPTSSPSPGGPAATQNVGEIPPPAPVTEATPSEATRQEPRAPEGPSPSLERLPARQAVSAPQPPPASPDRPSVAPQPPPAPPVRPPTPAVVPVTEERWEMPMPNGGAPAVSRNQESPPAPPADPTRRAREIRPSEASNTVDPAAIIDWLFNEYPARRQ